MENTRSRFGWSHGLWGSAALEIDELDLGAVVRREEFRETLK